MGKRTALRQRYGLKEDCNDCIATTCCVTCAICQEARELKFRSTPYGGICAIEKLQTFRKIFFMILGPTAIIVQPMGGNVYPQPGQQMGGNVYQSAGQPVGGNVYPPLEQQIGEIVYPSPEKPTGENVYPSTEQY
jgi:hypothetical protein